MAVSEIADAMDDRPREERSAQLLIRALKQGLVRRVQRGVYAAVIDSRGHEED